MASTVKVASLVPLTNLNNKTKTISKNKLIYIFMGFFKATNGLYKWTQCKMFVLPFLCYVAETNHVLQWHSVLLHFLAFNHSIRPR